MPFNNLKTTPADTDIDDDVDDDSEIALTPLKPAERAGDALARGMFSAVLTSHLRHLLKQPARLILIRAADEDAAKMLARHVRGLAERLTKVSCHTEPTKVGGRLEPVGGSDLAALEHGGSVILISQDFDSVVVPEALAAADAIITVPNPTLAIVRSAIRAVTGKTVRGLVQADIDGLRIPDFLACIRPGLSARECVLALRRAACFRQERPNGSSNAVLLEQLAMTNAVSNWAFATLKIMNQVRGGSTDPSALRFACLEGPPGTGKTTVAASLARSAGWAFIPTSLGEWFASSGGHLGDVIRAARRFFNTLAMAKGPVVGLLDEIDALPNRAALAPEDLQWWGSVVTFVLTEIDRLRKVGHPILLLAATNHFSHLDAALIRPGRLERRVSVLPPDESERRAVFANCLRGLIDDEGLSSLARLSVLATQARIDSWCSSAIAAAAAENRPLALRDLVDLISPRRGRSEKMDRSVALHEAGHAIVAHELGLPVAEISIIEIGSANGWVNTQLGDPLITRDRVERLATMLLGGRAADTVLGDGADAGAASDLESVNLLLRAAMLQFGLYGPLLVGPNADPHNWPAPGTTLSSAMGEEIGRLLDRASEVVRRRRRDIFRLVELLLVERVVTGEGLSRILEDIPRGDDSDLPGNV